MDFPLLFSPIKLGPLTIKNRIGGSCTTTGGADVQQKRECKNESCERPHDECSDVAGFHGRQCTLASCQPSAINRQPGRRERPCREP